MADLGPKREVAKNSNDLVCQRRRTNGSANNDIHPPLGVTGDFIVNGEELYAVIGRNESDVPKRQHFLTFWAQVNANTWTGNVETKLGVKWMRWTSPRSVEPLGGKK